MSKPIVEWDLSVGDGPAVGSRAAVRITTPHHTLGQLEHDNWVHTSLVQEVKENGDFVTVNTYYKKVINA